MPATDSSTTVDHDADRQQLRSLEDRRCRAISRQDLPTLRRLLDADLVHVHANGAAQNLDTYLASLTFRPRTTVPGPSSIRFVGADTAIMTGTLDNNGVTADGDAFGGRIHALRVWRRSADGWLLTAFAAAPLGVRP